MESPRSDNEQIEEETEERLKTVGDYKHGSIKRIKLIKFLTYSHVEFSPQPRLNVVVGPNGTGKSSILCAICLGLGGEPRLLGRASEVETFVQNGEDEAFIELELANEQGKDVVITRTIRRQHKNHSSFTWNGESVSGKKVKEMATEKFQIQIDNLCTFLPQEKVGNFSGFDPKSLLLETEKTLSENKSLYHTHLELIKLQEELHGGDDQVDSLQQKVEQLQMELSRMEREVQRMEALRLAEEQAELLRKKILWLKCDKIRENCVELKSQKEEAKEQLDLAQTELEPIKEAYEKAKAKLEDADVQFKSFGDKMAQYKKDMEKQKQKYENHDDDIETILAELNQMDTRRAQLQQKLQDQQDRVHNLQEQVNVMPSLDVLDEEVSRTTQEQKALTPQYQEKKNECQNYQRDVNAVEDEVKMAQRRLDKLNDEKAQRLRNVFNIAPEVKAAYDWIQQNRREFRKPVVGPIACEVTPQSNNAAAYLEQHVPKATLKSFVVQDKSDYDLLYRKVREELHIPINIIQVDHIPAPSPRMYSEEKMNMLKEEHGVIGYLDESLNCSDVVLQALKSSASIEKVLVGNDATQNSMDNRGLAEVLSRSETGGSPRGYCIFTSNRGQSYKYTCLISKYSHKPSIRVDDIKPARMLTRGASEEMKQRVEQELAEATSRRDKIRPSLERAEQELEEIRSMSQEAQHRVKSARENRNNAQKMLTKLQAANRKLGEIQAEIDKDEEGEKAEKVGKLNQRIKLSLKALQAHSQSYQKMLAATVKASGARLNREAAAFEESTSRDACKEAVTKAKDLELTFLNAKRQFSQEKALYRDMIQLAQTEAPLEDEDGNDTPLKEKLEVDLAQFATVEHAEAALEEAEQHIRGTVANRDVIKQFEEKKIEFESTQDKLSALKSRKETRLSELRNKTEPWENALQKIVAKVDMRFSRYMKELGCVGEVRLSKGVADADDDEAGPSFKDYGVQILVSFRNGVKPSVLSARVQSGGERSVSTIMYLMAMQDMMISPFRCVDEINQGLDDRNERLVFKRIVENSTKPPGEKGPTDHCGQYWLITPKLLPNLTQMEEEAVTIHCVFNGPYTLKEPTDWDARRLVSLRKRPRAAIEPADGEENNADYNASESNASPPKRSRK
mmetsp:Transcript_2900/g.5510  ORF Transcript_2900/g.5510 Transcript_2900/m.5510 type:complete len:1133 (+) Transcript_2900:146-3544(+)